MRYWRYARCIMMPIERMDGTLKEGETRAKAKPLQTNESSRQPVAEQSERIDSHPSKPRTYMAGGFKSLTKNSWIDALKLY